jgi:TatA/E family protein of Tat protein translocase
MNFFGMGPMEIMVILVVALIIFGPGKLPEIAGQAGKMVRDFRRATRDLTSEFQESIDDVQATMGEMKATVTDLQKETEALAQSIPAALDVNEKPKAAATSARAVQSGTTQPAAPAAPTAPAAPAAPFNAALEQVVTETAAPAAPVAVASKADPLADLAGFDDEQPAAPTPGA